MLAALFEHDGKFEFVIQLLRQMFRKNDWFFMPDDPVHALAENNPRHDGVRKARLCGFLVVLPEVARGVEEFLWNDRRFEPSGGMIVKERFTVATASLLPPLQSIVQSLSRSAEAGVATFEKGPHVGWNDGVRQTIERGFVLVIAKVEGTSGTEINDLATANIGTDAWCSS